MSLTTATTTPLETPTAAHLHEKETDADMEGVPLVSIQEEADKMETAETGSTQLVGDDEEIVVAAPLIALRARKMVAQKPPRKKPFVEDEGDETSEDGKESEDESSSAVEAEVVQHGEDEEDEVDVNDDEPSAPLVCAAPPSSPPSSRTPSPLPSSSLVPPSSSVDAEVAMVSSPSRTEGLLVQMMQQNTMIMMKQQEQNEKFMLFLQQQAIQTQANFQMLSQKVDTVSSRISQQEREINDLKRGVSFRAEDMEQGLDIISRKPNLRRIFEFIARYGMDTRTGYVVAFPVLIANKLCVAVSLQLLSYAMAAMFPINMKPQKDFTLAGLKALMNSVSTETVGHRTVLNFTSLFGVDSYSGTEGRQASNNLSVWRVYQATTFLKAVRASLHHAGESGLGILEPEIEPSAIAWTRTSRIMWSQASMLDKNATRRMAWAQTVQEEVLSNPAVKQFFQLVPTIMGPFAPTSPTSRTGRTSPSSPSSSRTQEALPLDEPFHFCGVEPMFDFPVKNHAQLVRERRVAIQREREAMEDKLKDDRIESQVVNGRNLRKRASSGAAPRGKVPRQATGSGRKRSVAEIAKSKTGPSRGTRGSGTAARTSGLASADKHADEESSQSDEESSSSTSSTSSRSKGDSSDSDDEVVRAPTAAPRGLKK